jgi:SAM-dependent methyltransferase
VSSPDPPAGPSCSEVEAGRSAFTLPLAYSVLTPVYDLALEVLGFGRSFKAAVAELADVEPGEAVLDLGCGTGTLLQALLARRPDARFTGLDPDPRVLAMARRRRDAAPWRPSWSRVMPRTCPSRRQRSTWWSAR